MLVKKKYTLFFYVLSLIVYITFRLKGLSNSALIAQPFVLISLAVYYIIITHNHKPNIFFLLALLFTLVGSLFFINSTLEKMMLALGLVFIANQFFLLIIVHRMNTLKFKDIILPAIIVYVVLILLVYFYYEVAMASKVIAIVYSFSLTLLLSFAIVHYRISKSKAAALMLAGIIFMIIRDFFNGLNKFLQLDAYYYFLLSIFAHALAMYLVCRSVVLEDKKKEEINNV